MKMRLYWMVLLALLLAGCQAEPTALPATPQVTRAEQTAFKGMELYSWQDALGRWQFALLPGTNRLKTEAEIRQAAVGMDALKVELRQLAPGESIFWTHDPFGEQAAALPPPALRNELHSLANTWRLNLVVFGE